MAKRTPGEVYAQLRAAGFDPASAVIETAIAGAESGWDDSALGDTGLENATWGPSYGLYQVRTLKADTGRGTDRDLLALTGDDAAQAKAAYDISHHGTDFSPWTTYTTGRYRSFLSNAQQAAGSPAVDTAATATPVAFGPWWLPWNAPGALAGNAASGARAIAIEAAFGLLGIGLAFAGFVALARPRSKAIKREAAQIVRVVT